MTKTKNAQVEKKVHPKVDELLDELRRNSAEIKDWAEGALVAIQRYQDAPCAENAKELWDEVGGMVRTAVPEMLIHAEVRLEALDKVLPSSHRDGDCSEG